MSAAAVRVSPEWLVLREPADAAARSAELAERLGRHLAAAGRLVIHDLGGGSGAMGRWLAPRLPGPQHWVVHDRDADLLELRRRSPARLPTGRGHRRGEAIRHHPAGAGGSRRREPRHRLGAARPADRGRARRMLGACAGCPMLLALTVVGRVDPDPGGAAGRAMGAAFNAHQRRGRMLGPDAVAAAVDELRGTGAEVLVRPSPWRLDAARADLTAEWFVGWVGAACEQEPALAAEAGAYMDRRLGAGGRRGARGHRRPRRRAGAAVTRRWVHLAVAAATPRGPGLAPGSRPVPRRTAHRRRLGAGGRFRPGRADHPVLRLALEGRGPWPRRRPAAGHGGGCLLPLALPQRRTARRGGGRRPPRVQPRP